ncbi:hypothetical protein RhiirC2_802188, partial [Rhizophagus irregularis]
HKIHLIIHEAHEQAIAFAKVLEFIGYKNLFYNSTFNTHVLACESDLLDDDLNQDHDDLKKTDNLEQSQIDYIYGQSDKKIIQKSSEIFQMGVLSSGELNISYLILQRRKHEAYSNKE